MDVIKMTRAAVESLNKSQCAVYGPSTEKGSLCREAAFTERWPLVEVRPFVRYDKSSYLTDMIGSDWIPSIILSSFCYNNNAQATTTVPHLTCNTEKIITKGC